MAARRRTTLLAIAGLTASLVQVVAPSAANAAAAASLRVEQTGLDFGAVAVGDTSAAQTVTIVNSGGAALSALKVGAPSAAFRATGSCTTASTLAAHATCTVSFSFTPTAATAVTSSSVITSSAGRKTIALRGAGLDTALAPFVVSSGSLAFGAVPIGTSSVAQEVVVRNTSGGSLTVAVAGGGLASGDAAKGFSDSGTCGGQTITLAAGGSCAASYAFAPVDVAPATGSTSLQVTVESGPASGTETTTPVSLSGSGRAPLLASTGILHFGDVAIGTTSATQVVTLTNTAGSAVSFRLSGGGFSSGRFTATEGSCGSGLETLKPSATCTAVSYAFDPDATGSSSASSGTDAEIYDGGVDTTFSQQVPVAVSGTGIAPLAVSSGGLAFGDAAVGATTALQPVTLTNISGAAVSFQVTGGGVPSGTGFTGTEGSCGSAVETLQAGASCSAVNYAFAPSATGAATTSTAIDTVIYAGGTDTNYSENTTVSLTGTGEASAADNAPLEISAGTLVFGEVPIGTTSTAQQVLVENTSGSSLTIAVAGGGFAAADAAKGFSGTGSCGGADVTLPAGGSCAVSYAFAPVATAAVKAHTSLEVTVESGPDTGTSTMAAVTVSGSGRAPLLISAGTLRFGDAAVGATAPVEEVVLTNVSGAAVSFQSTGGGLASGVGFTATVGTCGGQVETLQPGASCADVSYAFAPLQTGAQSATSSVGIQIYARSTYTGYTENNPIALSGTGLAPLNVSSGAFAFGDAAVGSTAPAQVLTVTNTSGTPASFQITGGGVVSGSGYTATEGTCGSQVETLQPGDSCSAVSYAFAPTQTGASTTGSVVGVDIYAGSTASGYSQNIPVSLTGSAVGPGPHLLVTPDGLNLGAVKVGATSAALTTVVRDTGTAALTGLSVGPPAGAGFAASSTCPATLAPQASCTVTYVLAPTAKGAASSTATVSSAAGDAQVALTGSGTAAG